MQSEETKDKDIDRKKYLDHYKESALVAKKAPELEFTEKSDNQSPSKKKRGKNQKKEIVPPSETYLQSATKQNPI
jgi:hypothetical protein